MSVELDGEGTGTVEGKEFALFSMDGMGFFLRGRYESDNKM